jgi:hypothetical protein
MSRLWLGVGYLSRSVKKLWFVKTPSDFQINKIR